MLIDDVTTAQGFLLSRHWRDLEQGIELRYWASSSLGPLLIRFTKQRAVCFCPRDHQVSDSKLAQRKPLTLRDLRGHPVDALYFDSQRAVQSLQQGDCNLLESDIKHCDRYLMERFINAGFTATGQLARHGRYCEMVDPKLEAIEFDPELSYASLDIETNGNDGSLYSIAISSAQTSIVFMLGEQTDSQHPDYSVRYFPVVTDLLRAFLSWFQQLDPDLIIGWNVIGFDLAVLEKQCQRLNIPFRLGRNKEAATVLPRDQQTMGPARARVPGRAVLDGIELLRAGFWSFESFSLDNVASELLGKRKTITLSGQQKVAEINRQFREDKERLAAYNLQDCRLVAEIFGHARLIAFAKKRAAMTGLDIDRMGGSVATFDNLYLPRLHRRGFVAPNIPTDRSGGLASPGGYVLDSKPGLYNNVLVLDFKSLYPSIIRTFLIDPLGLHLAELEQKDDCGNAAISGYRGAQFAREAAILPELIGALWQQRDAAKSAGDSALSQAIKIIMNSFYGVLGTAACRFYDTRLASSITLRGHDIIMESKRLLEQQDVQVIYGDTDSLFVLLNDQQVTEAQASSKGQELASLLNRHWQQKVRTEFQLSSYLEIEFETHYLRFLMPTVRGQSTGSKKRYAGLVRDGSQAELNVQIKGLEAARSDWTPLAREFQRELFWRVFTDGDYRTLVQETAHRLLAGELDHKLLYRKRLRRPLSDYQRNIPPHVQAARKLPQAGRHIEYLITVNGPEPSEARQSAPDYNHYLERQLAPAADTILHFLGCSFNELTASQLAMF